MNQFIATHRAKIAAVVSGYDRIVFRAKKRILYCVEGMAQYLRTNGVLLKQFGAHVQSLSQRLKEASLAAAEEQGRPIEYLASARVSKEERARAIAERDGIGEGLICVFKTVELCQSFEIYRNADQRMLELVPRPRKCLHLYHYWIDPVFGFMSARIQTWFPFAVQVCVNGREWLARLMDRDGIGYRRADNCFSHMDDYDAARKLAEGQLRTNWTKRLDAIARQLNPLNDEMFAKFRVPYYWTAYQTEWATDVIFAKPELDRLFPMLVRHGMLRFDSAQVMRFLHGRVARCGEVISDIRQRSEGVRIKHWHGQNSIKAYDKADGQVLRVETTINDATDFYVYRPSEGDPHGDKKWRPLRKGVADMHRRAQVCDKANARYLNALGAANSSLRLEELLGRVLKRTRHRDKSVRALDPFAADRPLLAAIARSDFAISGFRNRDLQSLLFGDIPPDQQRRCSSAITRKIRLLRAHGVIRKVPHTHRYQLTDLGTTLVTAVIAAANTPVSDLCQKAA